MPNDKKRTKFGLFLRKVFKGANLGAALLSLIDLSTLVDDKEMKDLISDLKKDLKGAKIEVNASNSKDVVYIFGVLAKNGVEELASALREAEKMVEQDEG